jgi:hypothetical protein
MKVNSKLRNPTPVQFCEPTPLNRRLRSKCIREPKGNAKKQIGEHRNECDQACSRVATPGCDPRENAAQKWNQDEPK